MSRKFSFVSLCALSCALPAVALAHVAHPLRLLKAAESPASIAPADPGPDVDIEVREVPVSEVVGLFFERVLRVSYVVAPGVNTDRRSVSFRAHGSLADVRAQMESYLDSLGYKAVQTRGVYKIAPLPEVKARADLAPFIYRVRWRDVADLVSDLAPLFPDGHFGGAQRSSFDPVGLAGSGGVSVPGVVTGAGSSSTALMGSSAAATAGGGGSSGADRLVFYGTRSDVARLRVVLPMVDTPVPELVVKAGVFEVDLQRTDNSALSVAQAVLGATKSLAGFGSGSSSSGVVGSSGSLSAVGYVGLGVAAASSEFDALLGALSSDQRFRLVTSPVARVRSGQAASLIVGDQVPVLGSVSYPSSAGGAPVQSVDYKNSGVILTARPFVRERVIDLDLREEISSFVATTTGVSGSPTLQQRTVTSALSVQDGALVFIGGLSESRSTDSGALTPLGHLAGSEGHNGTRTDILLVLQVSKVSVSAAKASAAPSLPALPIPDVAEGLR